MKLLPLLCIVPTAAAKIQPRSGAWDGNAPYNASGSVLVPSYDLSKPASEQTGERPNWNLTRRLKYNATAHDIGHASILLDPDHREDPDDRRTNRAIKGWERVHFFLQGSPRNNTDPVKADCSETLSPDCMAIIKKAGAEFDNINQEDQDACDFTFEGGSSGTGRAVQFGASRKGWLGSGGFSTSNLDIKSYDEEIRKPIIFYQRWTYEEKQVSDDFVCFGLDTFYNNSRTLAEALSDSAGSDKPNDTPDGTSGNNTDGTSDGKTDGKSDDTPEDQPDNTSGDNPKNNDAGDSAAQTTLVSWTVGLVALSLAL